MPRVERERKLAALANFDRSVEEIREITGPAGPLFPLAPNPMAASTVRSLKRRYGEYDDVLHRKQRVDGGTLRTAELQLLYSTFAGPDARAKTTTPQLQEQLIRRFLAGRAALGLPSSFPPATVNDAVRAMNHTYKLLTPQPLGVNLWERVLQHDLADYVRSVPFARCGTSAVCAHRRVSLCPVCLTAACCLVAWLPWHPGCCLVPPDLHAVPDELHGGLRRVAGLTQRGGREARPRASRGAGDRPPFPPPASAPELRSRSTASSTRAVTRRGLAPTWSASAL